MRQLVVTTLMLLLATFAGGSVQAQERASKTEASQHFERGLSLARQGDLDAALTEFQAAYAMSPHYSVLYNLGQTHSALGDPVAAVAALERYLSEGGDRLVLERRSEVAELIERQRQRIGSLELDIEPSGSEVHIDGRNVGSSPFESPLSLVVGIHGVAVSRVGYAPQVQKVEVTKGSVTRLVVNLEPVAKDEGPTGFVAVDCSLLDVAVTIGGRPRALTPVGAPLPIPVGHTTIAFERSGYRRVERAIVVPPARVLRVPCAIAIDPSWKGKKGVLTVEASEPSARVKVDGIDYEPHPLPVGRHVLRVELDGFRVWQQFVTIQANGNQRVFVRLQPTKQRVAEVEHSSRVKKGWALGIGIAGVGLSAVATTLLVWNSGRHADWVRDRRDLDHQLASGMPVEDPIGKNSSLQLRAVEIQRVDDVAAGTAIVGGAALVSSVMLWLGADRMAESARR